MNDYNSPYYIVTNLSVTIADFVSTPKPNAGRTLISSIFFIGAAAILLTVAIQDPSLYLQVSRNLHQRIVPVLHFHTMSVLRFQ